MKSAFPFVEHKAATDEEFVRIAANLLEEKINKAIKDNGTCILGLSGGSTPRPIYEAISQMSIKWPNVMIFLVDDRYVPAEDPDSNQRLVEETLLRHIKIPEDNLVFPDTTQPLDVCIARYIEDLAQLFMGHPPDVMTLGLGSDGHIASLFPPLPESSFGGEIVLQTTTNEFAVHERISVSPLIIAACRSHLLFMKGQEKVDVFSKCVQSKIDPDRWPLHIALATGGVEVVIGEWYLLFS